MNPKEIKIADFDYPLPDSKVAKYPLEKRDQSKLLVYKNGKIEDCRFSDLKNHLPKDTLLIFNDSKVMPVRIKFELENKKEIEIFCLEPLDSSEPTPHSAQWKCFVGHARKWKSGEHTLSQGDKTVGVKIIEKERSGFTISFKWNENLHSMQDVFETFGAIPIPPYLNRKSEDIDTERYQNVFAHHNGSVAAPTAGLHFTEDLLQDLKNNGIQMDFVTLHVGAGTFKPVNTETIGEHHMHMERMLVSKTLLNKLISATKNKTPITAVGTTSLRTLESIYWLGYNLFFDENALEKNNIISQWAPYETEKELPTIDSLGAIAKWFETNDKEELLFGTEIFITPTYRFKIIDSLMTNFHQPKSTLLLLVAAATDNNWNTLYDHALQQDYRFLSYGDSNLIFINK